MAGPPGGQQHTPHAFLTRTKDAAGPRSAPAAAGEPAGLGGAEGFPPPRHAPGGGGGGVPPEAEGLQARVAALEAEERALRAPLASEADAVAAERLRVSNAARMLNAEAEGLRARARQLDFQASALAHQLEEKEALLLQEKARAERKGEEVAQAKAQLETALQVYRAAEVASRDPGWRDWGNFFGQGLPAEVLAKVAEKVVAQNEAGWAAHLKQLDWTEERLQEQMANRKQDGNCLFVFALVCKEWRKAQLKVGGRLCSRAESDVILPGRVALAKWALAEGCPGDDGDDFNLVHVAAEHGHHELVRWLIQEQGFAMDETGMVMGVAVCSGNLELVRWLRGEGCDWNAAACESAAEYGHLEVLQWLRAEGCPWKHWVSYYAVANGHLEVLRWVRENGCEWDADTRDRAAEKFGYTDGFGNLRNQEIFRH